MPSSRGLPAFLGALRARALALPPASPTRTCSLSSGAPPSSNTSSNSNRFPIFWSPAQLALLEGSPVLRDIDDRKRNMRSDYDEVVKACPEFARFSFDQFLNVRTAVGSRNFGIVVNGDKRTAMVP